MASGWGREARVGYADAEGPGNAGGSGLRSLLTGGKVYLLCVERSPDVISVTARVGFIAYMVKNEHSK
jgi:hypothetical protein